MYTSTGSYTQKGTSHTFNEDRYALFDSESGGLKDASRGFLYAVLDGVGSAEMGMRAAQHIASGLHRFYTDDAIPIDIFGISELLQQLNQEICGWGLSEDSGLPLGAAAGTIAWFSPEEELVIFHAGDTLAIHTNQEYFRVITQPHLSGRKLSQYFGMGDGLTMDIHKLKLQEDDVICLCSDGITKSLTPDDIHEILQGQPFPERAAKELVVRAGLAGSDDDLTALVIELEGWSV